MIMLEVQICCIAAFSCYCFTTNTTYRFVQVKLSRLLLLKLFYYYLWV